MSLPHQVLLERPVTALPFAQQIQTMLEWANRRESRTVCVANVHMLMEAHWDPEFARVLDGASMVTPDGMPLVWMLRLLGVSEQDRVAGIDILLALAQLAPLRGISIFFLGSTSEVMARLGRRLQIEFPSLEIAGMEPLPFRPLTEAEDAALVEKINASGAGLVLVALGCPKQEKWMAQHQGQIQAVMVGLGGAFPVYAGIQQRAPRLVREWGLEWLYRLVQEPGRLWKRYGTTIPPFVWLAARQLFSHYLGRRSVPPVALMPLPGSRSGLKLGQILLRRGKITPAQLEQVLELQRLTHLKLGELMVELNLINDLTLSEALSEQTQLGCKDLSLVA